MEGKEEILQSKGNSPLFRRSGLTGGEPRQSEPITVSNIPITGEKVCTAGEILQMNPERNAKVDGAK